MRARRRIQSVRGVTLVEFLVLNFALCCAILGCLLGLKIGARYGVLGQVIGGLAGLLAGGATALFTAFLTALVYEPFDRFGRWWRPYPPPCENGTCRGLRDWKTTPTPDDALAAIEGLSVLAWQCKCGNLYAGGYGHGLQNRWVRILPDGKIRPYLKHQAFGRWKPDRDERIEPGWVEKASEWDGVQLPGWALPCLLSVLCAALALLAVYRAAGLANPIAPWFIFGCAALGFVVGCVAWRMGPPATP